MIEGKGGKKEGKEEGVTKQKETSWFILIFSFHSIRFVPWGVDSDGERE